MGIVKDLQQALYDPTVLQTDVLTRIEKNLNGELDIPDATNPFMQLIETNVLTTTAAVQEFAVNMRRMYPYLAETKEDLYHHLGSDELIDVFATPSKASFFIYVRKDDILTYGSDNSSFTELIIPRGTKITTLTNNLDFFLPNDVSIKLYTNSVFANIIPNTEPYGTNSNTVLNAYRTQDTNGIEWIIVEVELLQLSVHETNITIIPSETFNVKLDIPDEFAYIEAFSNDQPLNVTYSQFVYNINKPTLFVKPGDGYVFVSLPVMYLIKNMVSNNVTIRIYTTKGNIIEHIEDLTIDNFKITFPNNMLSSLPIYAKATTPTRDGKNSITFEELKNIVITKTTGDNLVPVTEDDIATELGKLGYEYRLNRDTILEKTYIVSKDIYDLNMDPFSYIDIYGNYVKIPGNINTDGITIDDEYMIIEPYTEFLLNDKNELEPWKGSGSVDDPNKIYFTPYKYVIDYKDTYSIRAYDINSQKVLSNYNLNYNPNIDDRIVISDLVLLKTSYGYELQVHLDPNSLVNIDRTYLKAELILYNQDGYKINLTGTYKETGTGPYLSIPIETTKYIDKNDLIGITNPINTTASTILINNEPTGTLVIYTTDPSVPNPTSIELVYDKELTTYFLTEDVKLKLYDRLEYLYSKYVPDYTARKYKTYEKDVYLRYTEDVYLTDENGIVIKEVDTDGDGENDDIELTLLHKAGDIVLDEDGNPIIQHKAGDIMLDEDGNPIIDYVNGVIHNVFLLLIPSIYRDVTNVNYKDYIVTGLTYLNTMLTIELKEFNDTLLENTRVLFKPRDNLQDVKLVISNRIYSTPNLVRPTINIYVDRDISSIDIVTLYRTINVKLQEGLRQYKPISEIENSIIGSLSDTLVSVKINNLDNVGDIDYKNYDEDSSRITVAKKLFKLPDNTTVITLDYEIKITKI